MENIKKIMSIAALIFGMLFFLNLTTGSLFVSQDADIKPPDESILDSFGLEDVTLLPSPFRAAMMKNAEYLLSLEADRLLAPFYIEEGLEPKAPKYGGWESSELKGHSLGHYLSAVSMMYAATGDQKFLKRSNYIVDELAHVQADDGYLGGIPDRREYWKSVVESDTLETENFSLNDVWSPWYNLHKVYAGLRDAYSYTDNQKAKEVLVKYSDWAVNLSNRMSDKRFAKMLETEFGGMNEVLADVYAITGEKKYLELAQRFNHEKFFEPLANGKDNLEGLHSNTQIPKIIGAARQYELTGNERLSEIAKFFWDQVALKRSYVIGGNSYHEYFGEIGELNERLGRETAETCNTYNMLKLTKDLMKIDPAAKYGDFYERALYNHILASQHPATGMYTYLMSLEPGAFKTFSHPYDSFWCCVGTGMENHTKYATNIYLHSNSKLYVNLFIPSELTWEDKGITIRQETDFPNEESTHLAVSTDTPKEFQLNIRKPYWAGEEFGVTVNGEEISVNEEKGYVKVDRKWRNGDEITINLPMDLHIAYMQNDDTKGALMYGPVVLAGALGDKYFFDPMPIASDRTQYFDVPAVKVPDLVTQGQPVDKWVQPVSGAPLRFETTGVGQPDDVELIPFYKLNNQHYTVYWNIYDNEQQRQDALKNAEEENEDEN